MKVNFIPTLLLTGLVLSLGNTVKGAAVVANALSLADAATERATFYATVGESPDNTEDFDGFLLGTVITTQVSGVVLSGSSATIETGDISGSAAVGNGALEVLESAANLVFTFDSPIDYFSFRDIDVAQITMTINFVGGESDTFITETTAGSGNSAEFVGYFRNDLPNQILSVELNGNGTGTNTMGIDTLEFGSLAATPGTPPIIVGLSPADGSSEVLISSDLVATFSEPMTFTGTGTVTIRNLTLGAGSDLTISLPDAQASVSDTGAVLTINPTTDLNLNTDYAVRISADALEDQAGDIYSGILNDTDWNFKTRIIADSTAPTILSTVPADGMLNVERSSNLVVTFDESVVLTGIGSVTLRNLTLGSGADTVISLPDPQVTISGALLTINPTSDFDYGNAYAVQISSDAVEDLSGNAFAGIGDDNTWNFSVIAQTEVGAVIPGAWSLVILPDTQKYAQSYPGIFSTQTAWIRDNVRRRNIRYVMHLGDIVNNNNDIQWRKARASMAIMNGAVPYTIVGGNHDYGPNGNASTRDTLMNDYFPYGETAAMPTFGGAMNVGKLDNTYHLFEAGGKEWIIFNLEWGPRDSTIAWARSIYDLHPTRKGILITHAYMYNDETRYDWATKGSGQSWNPHNYSTPGGVNDGQELWDKFVKDYNFGFTFNGHVLGDGTGYLVENNVAGDPVHQMLVNYQTRNLGGDGYMRILEFQPDGQTVKLTSYSPVYDSFLTAADQQFNLQLPLGAVDADNDNVLDYYDPDYDSDADGINNYDEFVIHGTHSDKPDSDGDGIGDQEEINAGTNPLQNDAKTVALLQADPASYGLFTEQMILNLNPNKTFKIEGNNFEIDLQMKTSNDLLNWNNAGTPVKWTLPIQGDKHFYRIHLNPAIPNP